MSQMSNEIPSELMDIISSGPKQLTNEIITNEISMKQTTSNLLNILVIIMFIVVCVVYFIIFIKDEKKSQKKIIMIVLGLVLGLFAGIYSGKEILKSRAIQYSIQNNSFEVVTDKVVKTKTVFEEGGKDDRYYIYLSNYGKHWVDWKTYHRVSEGELVYVVLARSKYGKLYDTGQIYSTREYKYTE